MQLVSQFNPIAVTSGQFDMTVQRGGHIMIANESSANLIITFGNGAQSYVPANDKRLYCVSGQMAQPHTVVKWVQQSTLPQANTVNQTVIEAYQPGENVPETYPSPLIRNTAVAGPITATKISLNVPIFTVGPGTTNVIEVFDTPGTNDRYITLDNFPSLSMYTTTNTITPIINIGWILGGPPVINFSVQNDGSMFLGTNPFGKTQFDTTGNLIQSTGTKIVAQLIDASVVPSGAADLGFHVANTNNIVNTVGGVDQFKANSGGFVLLNGTVTFLTGSTSRVSKFTGTATTVATAFNHGLGATPDLVLLTLTGTNTSLSMVKYDAASLTSTQVTIVSDSSRTFVGWAIKL